MNDRMEQEAKGETRAEPAPAPSAAAPRDDGFRLLIETIPQLVWRARGRGDWVWSSQQWQGFTGQDAAGALDRGWLAAVHPDDRDRTEAAWARAETEGRLEVEHRIFQAATGEYRWFETRALPARDAEGRVREWFGTATDIHDLKTLQAQQAHLLSELQHRVRNTLATVRAIARRSAETSESVEDYAMHLEGRLGAVSRIQSAIIRNPIDDLSLSMLVADELVAYHAREGEDFTIDGPLVLVPARAAERLALALHELATNAVKFGALAQESGTIAISWTTEERKGHPVLVLDWTESGLVLAGPETRRYGFGMDVLERMLPHDLRAQVVVAFRPDGLSCRIVLPLGAGTGAAAVRPQV
ncbi:sensor histidine kinase [Methylobacterium radiodurans]|uniref:Blue-light-activated histidine kinase n=1 Tax=Methylobacterium radiodurans TaxID=2202828 RepID=A0A2U8VM64_9HYPH|nr:HWE histidine kinase domain-containing protein [Methylobacterium radiodurans]AWN34476.1 histidine kinase [Methylobacterium radiodurans]